jgi:Protein of unknown function (DUF732)
MAIQLRTMAGIAIAGVAIGFAGLSAEAAGADSTADAFIARIKGQGITYSSPRQARDRAEAVCAQLADGMSAPNVAGKIYAESNLTDLQAAYFVTASVTFYCAERSDVFTGYSGREAPRPLRQPRPGPS